jgi:hypothetical protein
VFPYQAGAHSQSLRLSHGIETNVDLPLQALLEVPVGFTVAY